MKHELNEQWIEDGRMRKCTFVGEYISKSKDLGPVNEDGYLAEERTGLFPETKGVFGDDWANYTVFVKSGGVYVGCHAPTLQEAKDIWNRRE